MTAEVSRHEGAPPPGLDSEAFQTFGFGPDRSFECFVAEESHGLVGHVVITWGFDVQEGCRTVWLADLFVAAGQRRKGIGWRALMAHVYAKIGARRDGGFAMFLPTATLKQIAEQGL